MKAALLTVYYNTPEKYKKQLQLDCERLGLSFHAADATYDVRGYAECLNGLIEANNKVYDVFFLANPDISLVGIPRDQLFEAAKYFDIWGYTMRQHGKRYYGGNIDKWRMSGGLISENRQKRFLKSDFVSGSLMAVKKEVFGQIGFLNEQYFMYYEDVEFCFRAKREGLRVGIDTEQWYEHFETSLANPRKKKLLAKNRMKFLWENGSIKQKIYEFLRLPKTILEEGTNLL